MNIIGLSGKISSGKDTVAKIIQYLTCTPCGLNYEFKEWLELSNTNNVLDTIKPNWQIKKFAGKLKQIVSLLTGIPVEDLEKEEVKNSYLGEEWNYIVTNNNLITIDNLREEFYKDTGEYPTSNYLNKFIKRTQVRTLLQRLGTEALRDIIHPNVHINALFSDYKEIIYSHTEENQLKTLRPTSILSRTIYPNWIISDLRFPNEAKAIKERDGILIRINRTNPQDSSEYDIPNYNHPSESSLDNYQDWNYVIDNSGSIEDLVKKVKDILIKEKII